LFMAAAAASCCLSCAAEAACAIAALLPSSCAMAPTAAVRTNCQHPRVNFSSTSLLMINTYLTKKQQPH
jgi:hypothetical protein